MTYEPTSYDAASAYVAAATAYLSVPPNVIIRPSLDLVKQMTWGTFRITPPTRHDTNGLVLEAIAICMYDKRNELWYVRLQDGSIARVRNDGDGLAVLTD